MLPSTQTYIPAQASELRRYTPAYVGLLPAEKNFSLNREPVLLCSDRTLRSKATREAYRWTGKAPRFHQALRKLNPVLLHAHFAEGGSAAQFLSRTLNLPLLIHLHGGAELMTDDVLRKKWFEWPYLYHRAALWQRTSAFLCASESIRSKALRAGFPAKKLIVHYASLNHSSFYPSRQPHEKEKELIVYLGRLIPYKGCQYLLQAMHLVAKTRPDARLVIIGEGELRARLEQQARSLNLRCTFTGELPQAHVRDWLDKARVLCAPSVTLIDGQSEAFGLVFLEAQAMGTPVVSFRHGGIPETMREGETGLLADERDIESLARHIERYIKDDTFWALSRNNGMRWVRESFDPAIQAAKLENIYTDAIDGYSQASFDQHLA